MHNTWQNLFEGRNLTHVYLKQAPVVYGHRGILYPTTPDRPKYNHIKSTNKAHDIYKRHVHSPTTRTEKDDHDRKHTDNNEQIISRINDELHTIKISRNMKM